MKSNKQMKKKKKNIIRTVSNTNIKIRKVNFKKISKYDLKLITIFTKIIKLINKRGNTLKKNVYVILRPFLDQFLQQ